MAENRGRPWYPPNYNSLIETDPQIIKVSMDTVEWGTRKSSMNRLANEANVPGGAPSNPSAPEMTVKHIGGGD
jgi:hypothetical protein